MEELLLQEIKVGQVVSGEVLSVKQNMLILDLHQFTEGTMYLNEFDPALDSFEGKVKVGDTLEAVVKKVDEEHGKILLSRLPLLKEASDKVMDEYKNAKKVINVKIDKANEFGLFAKYLGNDVFVAQRDIDLDPEFDGKTLVGQTVEVKLRDFDDRRHRYVASRKELQLEEQRRVKKEELDSIHKGDVLTGEVSRIDEHLGVFVRFNHNQGLIRYRELSHVPFKKMEDVVKVGEKVQVKVIGVEGNKIDLSRKALLQTPYQLFAESHKVGEVIPGEVVQKLPIGAIVLVAPNVTGLLHKNEISWNPNDNTFASLKIGSKVEAAIISIDPKRERVSLSLKVLEDNPWAKVKGNVGDTVKAEITNIVAGKYLEVSCLGVTGQIPVHEVTMKEKSSKLEDYYTVGDTVEAIITVLDTRAWRLELSIKRHDARIERQQFEEYMKKEQEAETTITLGDVFKDILKK